MGERVNLHSAEMELQSRGPVSENFDPKISRTEVLSVAIDGAQNEAQTSANPFSDDIAKGTFREMSMMRRFLVIFWLVIIYGYNAIVLRYSIVSYKEIQSSSSFMREILQNWQQGAITDIVLAPTCPSGYEIPYSATFGTKAGCDCSSVDAPTLESNSIDCFVCVGRCNPVQVSAGCKDIASLGPFSLSYFAIDQGTQNSLCVKRSTYTYDSLAPLTSPGGCPSGYQSCATNTNSLYDFCISSHETCPINQISFEDVTSNPSYTCNPPDCFVTFLNTSTTSTVRLMRIARNTPDATPVSDIGINQASMCLSKYELNQDVDRASAHPFVLDANTRTLCNQGSSTAMGWNDFVSIKESELMTINGIYDKIHDVPGYDVSPGTLDYNWVLAYRTYIPFKTSCREYISRYTENADFVTELARIQTAFLYVNSGIAGFTIIILSFYQIAMLCGLAHYTLFCGCFCRHPQKKQDCRYKFVEGVNFFLYVVCQSCQLFFAVWDYIFSNDQTDFYHTLCEEGCTISPWADQICLFSSQFTEVFQYNFIIMVVLASSIFAQIIIITLECCLARRAKKEYRNRVLPLKVEDGVNSLVATERRNEIENAGEDAIEPTSRRLLKLNVSHLVEKIGSISPSNTYNSPKVVTNDTSTYTSPLKREHHFSGSAPEINKIASMIADALSKRPGSQGKATEESIYSSLRIQTYNNEGRRGILFNSVRDREKDQSPVLQSILSRIALEQSDKVDSSRASRKNSDSPLKGQIWRTPTSNSRGVGTPDSSQRYQKDSNGTNDFISRYMQKQPQNSNSSTPQNSNSESSSQATEFFKKFLNAENPQPTTFSSFYNKPLNSSPTIRIAPTEIIQRRLRHQQTVKQSE